MGTLLDELAELTPDEVAKLAPSDQAWVARQMEQELLLRSPADFASRLSRGMWKPYRHALYVSDAIVGMIERDECDVLLVDLPVRHGKTELCSRWTPAWFNCKFRQRVGLASYEADFAATHGRRAREIVDEFGARFGVQIDNKSHAAYRWDLAGCEGGMWSAGAGGPITGKGYMLGVVDDPIKGNEDAESAVMREKLWDWWQRVFLTRRDQIPGAKVMVIMSRWHDDDPIGRLVRYPTEGMRIKRLRLPAIAEEDDPLGRTPGQALCPERFDEVALAGIRSDIGPHAWASLYQQRPVLAGGGMFKRDWFQYWTAIVRDDGITYYQLGDTVVDGEEVWKFATMDTAYVRGKRSDYTAIATWGVAPTDPPSLILLDMRRKRVDAVDHAPLIQEVWDTDQPAWVGVEKISATLSLFAEVQRRGVIVRWLIPDRNKIARAETAAAVMSSGRVWLPKNAPWMADFMDELLTFPVGKHDDQVDVLSYAAAELARRTVSPRRVRHEPVTAADRMWERLEKRNKRAHLHPQLGRF